MATNIQQVSMKFHTNDEDKDGDTRVLVYFWSGSNRLVALTDGFYARFSEGDDFGPYDVMLINQVEKGDLLRGRVRIVICPNGDDTWRFNFSPRFRFEDGSKLTSTINGIEMSENARDKTYYFNGLDWINFE